MAHVEFEVQPKKKQKKFGAGTLLMVDGALCILGYANASSVALLCIESGNRYKDAVPPAGASEWTVDEIKSLFSIYQGTDVAVFDGKATISNKI